jgi:hypothetical protein
MVEVITEEPEAAPSDAPVTGLPASSNTADSDLDALLEQFTAATNKPAEPDAPTSPDAPVQDASSNDLDALLRDLAPSEDQKRADALQGQLNDLQSQMHRERELAAFNSYADDLAKQVVQVAPHAPDGWAKLKLESFAHDPEIRLAWDTRYINPQDAARDLAHVQFTLKQLQGDPNADPKQVQELNKLAYQLNIAAQSHSILRRVNLNILKEARLLPLPLDPDASADRAAVAFAVKEASSGDIPQPPIDFSTMTNPEFYEWCRKNIK